MLLLQGKTSRRMLAGWMVLIAGLPLGAKTAQAETPQPERVAVEHVAAIPPSHHPELLYWFFSPDQLEREAYLHQLDVVKQAGAFNFVFLTQRGSTNFYDTAKMHPVFADLVRRAHAMGLRVGLQLWGRERDVPDDQVQGIVVESEVAVDASGHAEWEAHSRGVRMAASPGGKPPHPLYAPVRSEVLRVFAFRKTGEASYAAGTLKDVTAQVTSSSPDPATLRLRVDSPALAGQTLYAMTVHYHRFPDLFAPFLPENFEHALEAYKDVGFDGAALDEFRYMTVGPSPDGKPFRERFYTAAMARYFTQRTGRPLERTLLEMRYVPSGDDAVRMRAINSYFDVLREGPLRIEQRFSQATTRIFGPAAFHGIHDTWHNGLDGDEVWGTGIDWWTIPRDYAQTDESTPMLTRLGMSMARPQPVEYNQYYSKDMGKLLAEGLDDARYNGRVHYHALHDVQGWGIDIGRPDAVEGIRKVQEKVRLLDAFDAPRPAMNVLFLFGMPSLLNYDQPGGVRSDWDINAGLHAEQKALQAWNAGYRCALAPTELLDSGVIRVDGKGGMIFGGQRFTAVVMIGPEFSKETTLRSLEQYVGGGGKILFDGAAAHDFEGKDVSRRFAALASKAVGTTFSMEALGALGAPKMAIDGGALFADGSVVLTDTDSVLKDQPKEFRVTVEGHVFSGSYEGLLALKVSRTGELQKVAAGHLSALSRDGKPVLKLDHPADVVLLRDSHGQARATVVGEGSVTLQDR